MGDQPRTYRPLDTDGRPDHDRVQVELFQHRPGQTDALVGWSGGRRLLVNAMPCVVLPNGDPVGLGDYALRFPSGRLRLEPADGLATRYSPVEEVTDGSSPP
ncbi:hypothetical protein DMP17_22235 [Pseudonocardia sp. TMWB2A]|uniref:hypothetical protein n=1 Tax=Pseudonocardia sp. TMWB2A TaxID=687430 RepID=UPI00307F1CB0